MKELKIIAVGTLLVLALVLSVVLEVRATERTLPAGLTSYTEVIDVVASQSTLIDPIWSNSTVSIMQAYEETDKFRVALGTSTVDAELPLLDSFSVTFSSGGFLALQAATDTIRVAVYRVKN